MYRPSLGTAILTAGLACTASAASACGACGCTLNSDWASQGFADRAGLRVDLRFDTFTQDELRMGTGSVPRSSFAIPNGQEIQQKTINRNTTLGLDWSPNAEWGLSLLVPVFDRYHTTVAAGDTDISTSRGKGLGDVRVAARYQGFLEDHSFGVQLGLKLPTGTTRDAFKGGPQTGEPVDRGLQLGTGTTDLLLGIYKHGDLSDSWGYFAQALFQKPLNTKDGFRPGDGVNVNAGVRYTGYATVTPHLQVNVRAEGRESGASADVANSGATLAYLSPGLTVQAARQVQVFAFFQVPVTQRVNGLQIEPRSSVSVGLHMTF